LRKTNEALPSGHQPWPTYPVTTMLLPRLDVLMLTLTTALLLLAVIIIALYAFGVFNTPYLDAFRFAFYLLLALLVMSIWFGVIERPYEGYDPRKAADR